MQIFIRVIQLWLFLSVVCVLRVAAQIDPDKEIRQTFQMDLGQVTPICISGSVTLKCPDNINNQDVLGYEWRIKGNSTVIATTRDLVVSPLTTTNYELQVKYVVRSDERITNGEFEAGDVFNQAQLGFTTDYTHTTNNSGSALNPEGLFKIAKRGNQYHASFANVGDCSPVAGQGYMMVVNGNPAANAKVWEATITGLIPGKQYAFGVWGVSLVSQNPPKWRFTINGVNVGSEFKPTYNVWSQFYVVYTAVANTAVICLVDNETAQSGNDFAIDGISFAPIVLGTGEVEVRVLPKIKVADLTNLAVCEESNLRVQPTVNGSDITAYEWRKGTTVVNTGNPYLDVTTAELSDAGTYTYKATGICGSDSASFNLTVKEKLRFIPVRDTAFCNNTRADLKVNVTSGYNVKYSWKNWAGVVASGWQGAATTDFYKLAFGSADVGKYTCTVTSDCGSFTGVINATLDVPTAFTTVPQDTTKCVGSNLSWNVVSNKPGKPVEWTVPGATTPVPYTTPFTINGVQMSNAGLYTYKVTGACDSKSGVVSLEVRSALTGLSVSADTVICPGKNVILKSIPVGGEGVKCKWYDPTGRDITTGSSFNVTISNMSTQKEGNYAVVVTDNCGNMLTDTVYLGMFHNFDNVTITPNQIVCPGDNAVIQVMGAMGVTYTWTLPNKTTRTGSKITLNNVTAADTGLYVCQLNCPCGSMALESRLSFYQPIPALSPVVERKCPGENVTFSAPTGGTIVGYNWTKGSTSLGTSSSISINPIQASDGGVYTCMVTGTCETKPVTYELQVKPLTQITSYTPDLFVNQHSPVQLFVNAIGENNTYEWRRNGVVVGGNSNILNITDIGTSGVNTFTVKVKGDCSEETVTIIVTVGDYIPVRQDTLVNLCEGRDFTFNAVAIPAGCSSGSPLTYKWEYNGSTISNTSLLDLKTLATTAAGVYTCTISGACGIMIVKLQVGVIAKPRITGFQYTYNSGSFAKLPDVIELCEEEQLTVTAVYSGTAPLTFEWSHNGTPLPGETSSVLHFQQINMMDIGSYTCRVVGVCDEATSSFTVIVRRKLRILDSQDVTEVCRGTAVEFEVTTSMAPNVTYSWTGPGKFDWSGANTPIYSNPAVTIEDMGIYRCVINSSCGIDTVYSELKVERALSLLEKTENDTVCPGTYVELFARVNLARVNWQWTLPNGGSSASERLVFNGAQKADAGTYHFTVQNWCNDEVTGDIILGIYDPIGTLTLSPDTAVCEHSTIKFVSSVTGSGLQYRWIGPNYAASTAPDITVSDVRTANTGRYELSVTDICGNEQRGSLQLSLLKEFDGLIFVGDTTLCEGDNLSWTMQGGAAALQYTWKRGQTVVGTGATLNIANATPDMSDEYTCVIVGTCNTVERKIRLSVYKTLEVSAPVDAADCIGTDVEFTVTADGEGLSYLWNKGGVEKGDRTKTLKLPYIIPTDAGVYECLVTSACGSKTVSFELTVKEPTSILSYVSDKFVAKEYPTQLSVLVEGVNNKHEWKRNGVVLTQENQAVLDIPNVGPVDTLYFTYTVKGDCGMDSVQMRIKVGDYIRVQEDTSAYTVCEYSTYRFYADITPHDCYGYETFNHRWEFNGNVVSTSTLLELENLTPAQAGRYTYHMDHACGDTTLYLDIHVTNFPKITKIDPASAYLTEGEIHKIQVTATGDSLAYSWKKDGIELFGLDSTTVRFEPLALDDKGVYRVTVENGCGSIFADSRLDVWKKLIMITPKEQDVWACWGTDTTFTVEAIGENDIEYKWYYNDVLMDVAHISKLTLPDLEKKDEGTYKCILTSRGGTDTCYIYMHVNELPDITIKGSFKICMNDTDIYQDYDVESSDSRLIYQWSIENGTLDSRPDRASVKTTWTGTGNGTISVEVTSLTTGCYNSAKENVILNPLPVINFVVPDTVGYCLDSLKLDMAYPTGGIYTVNGVQDTRVKFDNKWTNYYTVYQYTDPVTGCSASIEKTIIVDREPYIYLKQDTVITGICKEVELDIIGHSEGSIQWRALDNLVVNNLLNAVFTPALHIGADALIQVELTDRHGCKASDGTHISIIPAPEVRLMKDTVIGVCNDLILTCGYYAPYFSKMEWDPAASVQVNVNAVDSALFLIKDIGNYNVTATVTDLFGCVGTDTVNVTIEGILPEDKEVCVTDALAIDCSIYSQYVWSDGYSDVVRVMDQPGEYFLEITDKHGCTADMRYNIHPVPVIHLADTFVYIGKTVDFVVDTDPAYGPYQIRWQDGSSAPVMHADKDGLYSVVVSDNVGCSASDSAYFEIRLPRIIAPSGFLPKSTGENSKFYLKEIDFVGHFEMFIYDRWGELVYKTEEIGFKGGWDGTYKGKECMVGAYVWIAFIDGKEIGKGSLMLIK